MAAVAIGVVSGLGLFLIWWSLDNADQGTLAVEAGKTLMQVIGVVLLGAVFSYAANSISLKFQNGMAVRQLLHTSAEAERVRKHSDWQRQTDQEKDQRLRQDELRRALLEATITNYNAVKRARRRLRAAGYRGGPEAEQRTFGHKEKEKAREIFVDVLERMIEVQLEFERLSKTAELAGVSVTRDGEAGGEPAIEIVTKPMDLGAVYTECAQYLTRLGDFVNDAIPDPGPQQAEPLGRFLAHRTAEGGFGDFARRANAAMKALRVELTKPMQVTPEGDSSIDMAKVEVAWRQVLAKAPFSK